MSAIFGFNEASAVAAFSAICMWATHVFPSQKFVRKMKVEESMEKPRTKSSMWNLILMWFRWSWLMETAALAITLFYFAQNTPADSWNIIAGTVCFFAYLVGIKGRNMIFWNMYQPGTATAMGLSLPFVSAVGFYISMCVDNLQGLWYVPVATFSVHFLMSVVGTNAWMWLISNRKWEVANPGKNTGDVTFTIRGPENAAKAWLDALGFKD